MAVGEHAAREVRERRFSLLLGGGIDGNEQLTAIAGSLLLVLFAALGVTIVFIGRLLWLHLFLGLALIGPVVLKLTSTGYRFARYYASTPAYREKGPPHPIMRGIAPLLVGSTLAVFATGVVLLAGGRTSRDSWLLWHKVTFIAWLVAMAPHVLWHLFELPGALAGRRGEQSTAGDGGAGRARAGHGGAGRAIALLSAVVAGAVLAIILIPDFAAWTAHGLHPHHG